MLTVVQCQIWRLQERRAVYPEGFGAPWDPVGQAHQTIGRTAEPRKFVAARGRVEACHPTLSLRGLQVLVTLGSRDRSPQRRRKRAPKETRTQIFVQEVRWRRLNV